MEINNLIAGGVLLFSFFILCKGVDISYRGCHKQIDEFIDKLMKEWKESHKK